MSRIGKTPIEVPAGVTVTITDEMISISGPKGALTQKLHPSVSVSERDGVLTVAVKNEERDKAVWGLFGSLILNMVKGVTDGYEKKLEVNGVGYKVNAQGNKLVLNVGFSHPVEFQVPADVTLTVDGNVISIAGPDKQVVGQVAAEIRAIKKPEPYKGKGIKYSDEIIRRKAGKAGSKD
jgi:large subunit ribosomal protein L6